MSPTRAAWIALLVIATASASLLRATLTDTPTAILAPIPSRTTAVPPLPGTAPDIAEALARPPFAPSRRAAHPIDDAPPADAAEPPTAHRLAGIIIGPNLRQAVFAPTDGGRPLVLGEGERIDGETILAIAPDAVTLAGPAGPHRLLPRFDAALPQPPRRATLPPPSVGGPPPVGGAVIPRMAGGRKHPGPIFPDSETADDPTPRAP